MFYLGDFAIDRMVGLVAENDNEILYVLKQCQEGNITVSAESTDIVDKNGTLVRRTYKAKTGEISITNAMLNVNAMNASSGSDLEVASTSAPIEMPKIISLKANETAVLKDVVAGTIRVKAYTNSGATGATIPASETGTASATEYGYDSSTNKITMPSDTETKYIVKYYRSQQDGVAMRNASNKFPTAVETTIKALYIDPCFKGVKALYIVCPNVNVSPEVTIPLTAGETFEYTGALGADFCSDDKDLYIIYVPDEEDEDDF